MGIDPLTLGAGALGLGAVGHIYGAERSSSSNEKINAANIQMQKEINAQNEALMREGWRRDDAAVMRRAQDLERAGLSKTLAAGSAAAASSPIKLDAPQAQQTDNAWAGAGASLGNLIAGSPYRMVQMEAAKAQANLTNQQWETELKKPEVMDSEIKKNAALSAQAYASAGLKGEAKRIANKQAKEFEEQDISPGDKSFLAWAARNFPDAAKNLKQALTDPYGTSKSVEMQLRKKWEAEMAAQGGKKR